MVAGETRYKLEALTSAHSIQVFTCGEDSLDEYLQTTALSDMAQGLAKTFVLIDLKKPATEYVAGFFTLRAHALCIHMSLFPALAGEEEWEEDETIEVPLVELMCLARNKDYRGLFIGDVLMMEALAKVAEAASAIGFIGIHLRSTDEGVRLYTRYDFERFMAHPDYEGMAFRYDEARYYLSLASILEILA